MPDPSPPPVAATLFAYQVGFGDCFLLRFTYPDGARRHVLIDFGTTGLPLEAAKDQMRRVAEDIADKCGGSLDVVVATHRHADHISGFATGDGTASGDIIARLKPRVVVQPWTEAVDAPEQWLGPEPEADRRAFAARRQSLAAMQDTARQAAEAAGQKRIGKFTAVAERMRFIGEDNIANVSAVSNLATMGARNVFIFHGCDPGLGEELPGIEVVVLGPPTLRQTDTIRKQRSRSQDEFWHLAPLRFAESAGIDDTDKLFPDAETHPASKLIAEQRWVAERIDQANAEMMLGIVTALDKQMNNTSAILLFKAGSKSLLFPGDAQLENWAFALQSPLAPLLDDVDLYKVGHHGSLNATPKSMWERFARKGDADSRGPLTSVMSTRDNKHGHAEDGTEVPRSKLVRELKQRSTLVDTRELPADALFAVVEIDLT
ncbi:MAG: hypothetical protein ABW194_07650 [Novosphingobium sp.]